MATTLTGQQNFQVRSREESSCSHGGRQVLSGGGGEVWDKIGHAPTPGDSQSPPVPGTAQSAHPRVPKSVDDSIVHTVSPFLHLSSGALADSSKRPSLWPPKKVHSSGGLHSVSSTHPAASHRPTPSPSQPVQPNLDRSASQRTAPKLPRNDTLARANMTRDRRHRRRSKRPFENHPTPRPRISRQSHSLPPPWQPT